MTFSFSFYLVCHQKERFAGLAFYSHFDGAYLNVMSVGIIVNRYLDVEGILS